jgi:hypothetical protein
MTKKINEIKIKEQNAIGRGSSARADAVLEGAGRVLAGA